MNPHASRFDDPQCTRDRLILENSQETLQSADDPLKCCSWPHVQHDYSGAPLRAKSRNSDTQIRVPLTQGLPPQTWGSMAIRFKSVFMTDFLSLFIARRSTLFHPLSRYD